MNTPHKRAKPEPVQQVKQRRDAALQSLIAGVPYIQHMGFRFDRHFLMPQPQSER